MIRFLPTIACAYGLLAAFASAARAQTLAPDHVYVVERRDTLSSIAQHLGVPLRALAERNHLDPPYALRVGRRLRLPDEVSDEIARRLPMRDPTGGVQGSRPSAHGSRRAAIVEGSGSSSRRLAARAEWGRVRRPGFVRLVRENNDEQIQLNLRRATRRALRHMQRLMRSNDGREHSIHPRLLRLVSLVSDHFGGRRIHVISGYRPFRRGQWTAHSNHNVGHAIDFRVEGVPNRVVRNFCRTLENTGCGYYPRSVFVHMDVRDQSAAWVDWSRPGQRPNYGREDRPPPENSHAHATPQTAPDGADEGVDDVAADNDRVRTATPDPHEQDDTPSQATAGGGSGAGSGADSRENTVHGRDDHATAPSAPGGSTGSATPQ